MIIEGLRRIPAEYYGLSQPNHKGNIMQIIAPDILKDITAGAHVSPNKQCACPYNCTCSGPSDQIDAISAGNKGGPELSVGSNISTPY